MQQANIDEATVVDDVPVAPLLSMQRSDRYGAVPGLDDDELADPVELERQILRDELAPVLQLPARVRKGGIYPSMDEDGRIEWGAFGTVDFERMMPAFDRALYKAKKLKDELKDVVILTSIVNERIPGRTKYRVLKLVRMGWLDVDDIANEDMRALAKLFLRGLRLRREIAELREVSQRRRLAEARRTMAWLDG